MGDDFFLSQDEIGASFREGPVEGSAGGGESLTLDEAEILKEVASIMVASATGNVVGMLAGRTVSASVGFAEALPQNTLGERIAPQPLRLLHELGRAGQRPRPGLASSERGALTLADLMMGDAKELPEEANDLYSAAQEGLSQLR